MSFASVVLDVDSTLCGVEGIDWLAQRRGPEVATRIHNAWLRTIEDGVHTADLYREGVSAQRVGTCDFAEAVIARLGQEPQTLAPVHYSTDVKPFTTAPYVPRPSAPRELARITGTARPCAT